MSEAEHRMREAKRLTAQAASHVEKCQGCVDLSLAVNMLIGLVEGHRHTCAPRATGEFKGPYSIPVYTNLTGPMQAMEGRQ